jgi:iron-regulated transporter 1
VGDSTDSCGQIYEIVPGLQKPKRFSTDVVESHQQDSRGFSQSWRHLREGILISLQELAFYFCHRAFTPSFCGAILYFTVLSFGGQMVTYLLSVGYSSTNVGIARTLSVAFEISATWITPIVMSKIGPIRTGLWFIGWQMLCLAGAASTFWGIHVPLLAASGLVGGTILSRVGLWGFSLSIQIIIQEVLRL